MDLENIAMAYPMGGMGTRAQHLYTAGSLDSTSAVRLYTGDDWSILSGQGDLFFRDLPGGDQLHVHVGTDGQLAWASLNSQPQGVGLTNYEAAMIDLYGELNGLNKGGKIW